MSDGYRERVKSCAPNDGDRRVTRDTQTDVRAVDSWQYSKRRNGYGGNNLYNTLNIYIYTLTVSAPKLRFE